MFAEPAAGRIIRFDQDGSNFVTILASSSLLPEGPSFSASGDLFVATRQGANGAVWRIPGGTPGATPTQATASFTGFSEGTAFTRQGELLAVDTYGARVVEFAQPYGPTNQGSALASGSPYWNGITVGDGGDLYVAYASGGRILHFDPTGTLLGNFTGMRYPSFLKFGPDGYLYATDFVFQQYPGEVDSVVRIAPDGSVHLLTYLVGALGLAICPSPGMGGSPLLNSLILPAAFAAVAAVAATLFVLVLKSRPAHVVQARQNCPHCGATIDWRSSYCTACGKPLRGGPP